MLANLPPVQGEPMERKATVFGSVEAPPRTARLTRHFDALAASCVFAETYHVGPP